MNNVDRIIQVLETIRALEARILIESDPRERADMASTLTMLNTSLDFEVRRYTRDVEQEKKGGRNEAA